MTYRHPCTPGGDVIIQMTGKLGRTYGGVATPSASLPSGAST